MVFVFLSCPLLFCLVSPRFRERRHPPPGALRPGSEWGIRASRLLERVIWPASSARCSRARAILWPSRLAGDHVRVKQVDTANKLENHMRDFLLGGAMENMSPDNTLESAF